ncbi:MULTISPECIES: hypothetical protein [Ralstonia solanacearum species complex]|uniref:hypothetical protein n=1 Tax=Ralstonia solanacearum species complex TaxID=3116862 RepID=UPI0011401792|nr:hypothetical protein [Ralstonia solanacearum]
MASRPIFVDGRYQIPILIVDMGVTLLTGNMGRVNPNSVRCTRHLLWNARICKPKRINTADRVAVNICVDSPALVTKNFEWSE